MYRSKFERFQVLLLNSHFKKKKKDICLFPFIQSKSFQNERKIMFILFLYTSSMMQNLIKFFGNKRSINKASFVCITKSSHKIIQEIVISNYPRQNFPYFYVVSWNSNLNHNTNFYSKCGFNRMIRIEFQ